MKRITAAIIFVGMILILAGCGKTQTPVPDAAGEADAGPRESVPADKEAPSVPPPADSPAPPSAGTPAPTEEDTIMKPDPTIRVDELKEKFPEYFDLSAFKGLEVYVWQMAPDSWSCGVLPGTNREKTPEELWNMKGTTIEEMRAILSTYDIPKDDIIVIPWQNPISSYLSEYWIVFNSPSRISMPRIQCLFHACII